MTIESSRRGDRIDWLDYARFISALAVVAFHYLSFGPATGRVDAPDLGWLGAVSAYGYLGVDFFFIVSGFVIMLSVGERSPGQFAAARIIRLYPAFLVCMTATAIVLALAGWPVSMMQWAANLTMLPNVVGVKNMDGVYWSLYFEIFFYAAVWLVLVLRARRHMERIVYGWLALQTVSILVYPVPFFSGFYTLFAAGCVFSFARMEGWSLTRLGAIILALILSLHQAAARAIEATEFDRDPLVAIGCTLIFFAVFAAFHHADPKLPAAKTVGALTYPVYLLHAYIGYVALGALAGLPYLPAAALTLAVIVASAYLVAEFVERRPRPTYWRWANAVLGRLEFQRRAVA